MFLFFTEFLSIRRQVSKVKSSFPTFLLIKVMFDSFSSLLSNMNGNDIVWQCICLTTYFELPSVIHSGKKQINKHWSRLFMVNGKFYVHDEGSAL